LLAQHHKLLNGNNPDGNEPAETLLMYDKEMLGSISFKVSMLLIWLLLGLLFSFVGSTAAAILFAYNKIN
jgi:hypothetical protein